ncbi:MAG: hypothetical protein LKJ94_05800 [Candidatus Methanomethylophilus sp.]|jgi:hypothetical protein|nr:hypothetical protein [Methanomethylophilus sp.]MCI2092536.1 hypothetical protein [Methanomethylophilus sp.]
MRKKEDRTGRAGRGITALFGGRRRAERPGGAAGAPAAPRPRERPRRDYGKPLKIAKAPAKTRPVSPGDIVSKSAKDAKKK